MFDALNSVAGITLPSNQRRDHSPHPSSTQDVGSESRKSTADFELTEVLKANFSILQTEVSREHTRPLTLLVVVL